MDNHGSHLSIEALDIAKENEITRLTLHPHISAKLQPLNVQNPGKCVTIYDLSELTGTAFMSAITPTNIINAFEKTGIHPFDRDIFIEEDFLPSTVTDRPNHSVIITPLDVSLQDIKENEQSIPSILENETQPMETWPYHSCDGYNGHIKSVQIKFLKLRRL